MDPNKEAYRRATEFLPIGHKDRDALAASIVSAIHEERERNRVTNDALVASLLKERETLESIRHGFPVTHYGPFHVNDATMSACRDAIDRIDAVLAKVGE